MNAGNWSAVGLDFLRFTLALAVVAGHLTQPLFQDTWPDLTRLAVFAVGGFFVLSGYTIRALSQRQLDFRAGVFIGDRLARLLSVSVPALGLTIVADIASAHLAPHYYQIHFGDQIDAPFMRILANLFLISQLYGHDLSPFSNSPFWSLSYELGFYTIWACLMHWRRAGGSMAWPLGALVFFGPHIVVMLPFWLLGAVLFDIGRCADRTRVAVSVSMGLLIVLLCAGLASFRLHGQGLSMSAASTMANDWLTAFFQQIGMPKARASVLIMVAAMGATAALIPLLLVGDLLSRRHPASPALVQMARKLAALTFPLYLLHLPLLVMARSANLYDPRSAAQKVLLVLALIAMAAAYEPWGERLKLWLRHQFNRPWPGNAARLPVQSATK